MISMKRLGMWGRLGNQMFQYAALKGIATNRGFDFCIPGNPLRHGRAPHDLFSAFVLDSAVQVRPRWQLFVTRWSSRKEQSHRFDAELFETCPDGTDLLGYFQSEKYFAHIRDRIRADFTFRTVVDDSSLPEHYVSIHVRRGDYVEKQFAHPLCTDAYYIAAMDRFPTGTTFVVFSDDIDWCRSQSVFSSCVFSAGRSMLEDMSLMSRADHNVIANSSFSWWAAWLNPNPDKIVVAPTLWFDPTYLSPEQSLDLVPEAWDRIDGW